VDTLKRAVFLEQRTPAIPFPGRDYILSQKVINRPESNTIAAPEWVRGEIRTKKWPGMTCSYNIEFRLETSIWVHTKPLSSTHLLGGRTSQRMKHGEIITDRRLH
jgi:hypothetical protein